MATLEEISEPGRLAEPGEGVSARESAPAARIHGMPLEALRDDLTPAGLHYLLIHYDIPEIAAPDWRLRLDGLFREPRELDLVALRGLKQTTVRVTMECAGNGRAQLVEAVGTADWTGVSLKEIAAAADLDPAAAGLVFTGADQGVEQDYRHSLPLSEALDGDVLLAYAMNGEELPPQHGFPVRLIVPGWYGIAHVKWLVGVTAVAEPFQGFQQAVTRMAPRALLIPPGEPDLMSPSRVLREGMVELRGRAWSGREPVASVQVSVDGGYTWAPADLQQAGDHRWAWRQWRFRWEATPGRHVLMARAVAADGEMQPDAAQRVEVLCTE